MLIDPGVLYMLFPSRDFIYTSGGIYINAKFLMQSKVFYLCINSEVSSSRWFVVQPFVVRNGRGRGWR